MNEHLFLYRIKDSDDRDCCAYIDAAGPKFECNHYFSSIDVCGSCYSGSEFPVYEEIETILKKMNMKRFLHLTYLSKHLGMESRKVIVDTEWESNLLILLNISMIN